MTKITSPSQIAASLQDLWAPVIVTQTERFCIKVARIKGELGWHSHDGENKIFQVLKGILKIEMENETVELHEGEMYVVQQGIRNNPRADEECHIMFIEPL